MDSKQITLTSFGYVYGIPPETDLLISVKKFPNPPKSVRKNYDGTCGRLQAEFYTVTGFDAMYQDVLDQVMNAINEKPKLTIGIGCEKGIHRSVAIVERLSRDLINFGVQVVHRDLDKKSKIRKVKQDRVKRRDEKRNLTYDY